MILLSNLAFDCVDAARVAAFWRRALLYDAPEPTDAELAAALEEHPEWAGLAVVDEEGNRHPRLFLQTVPKPRAVEIDAVKPQPSSAVLGRDAWIRSRRSLLQST